MKDEFPIKSIGHEIKAMNHIIQRLMLKSASEAGIDKVTLMHGWIIGYLAHNSGSDIYQRDIESAFAISRSTVTNILKCMEKNGYIRRESVSEDARLKKLTLTEKGVKTDLAIQTVIGENEERLANILTDEERSQFFAIAQKLRAGLEQIEKQGEHND